MRRLPRNIGRAEDLFRWNLAIYWILLAPMLFFAVMSNFSFVDLSANTHFAGSYGSSGAGSGNSAAHSAITVLVYMIVALVSLRSVRSVVRMARANIIVFALPVLAILSTGWSQFPSRTALYSLYMVLNTIFALYVSSSLRPLYQLRLYTLTGAIATASSILICVFEPAAGIDNKETIAGGWQGIFPHKNVAGLFLVLFLLPLLCTSPVSGRDRLCRWCYGLVVVAFIVMTQSRTAWLVGIGLFLTVRAVISLQKISGRFRVLALILLLCTAVGLMLLVGTFHASVLMMLGKDPTMTGRTIIWSAVLSAIAKRPILGFGYYAFWNGRVGEALNVAIASRDLSLGNAENGVLQLWLELGLVGVIVLFVCLARTCRNAVRLMRIRKDAATVYYLAVIVFTLLATVDGVKLFYPHFWPWIAYISADVSIAGAVAKGSAKVDKAPLSRELFVPPAAAI